MATNYSGYDEKQYNNQSAYLNNLINNGTAGQKAWAQNEMNSLNSQYKPQAQPTQTTQPSGGSASVSSKPAQTQTSTPASTGSTNAFTTPGSQVADSGTRYLGWGENDQYKVKDYLSGNTDLQYALEQYMKDNNTNVYDIEGYAKDMYNRVGTQRADGSVVTLDDVNKELDRLGLSDYNSQNVTHTAGGSLIPNNEFVTNKTGGFGTNSEDSTWLSYGGQDYLVGGDSANFVDYVNGKTGNTTNLDYLFDDMANNPYAKEDAEFAQMYQNALNQFNNSAGIQMPTAGGTGTGGSYTGYDKVDQIINYGNALSGYNQATGGTSDIWGMIQEMLQGGLDSQKAFLDSQRTQAEQNAENLMRQAYVNQKLQGDSIKEALSAAGLGTTGAMQSAQLGVQSNYNNNVADIRANLNQLISALSEQELQALIDYTNNATKYAYQIRNDEADQAYRNAQLYMQQLEMQQAMEQQAWENAYKQQLLELEKQQYEDSQAEKKASVKNNGSGSGSVSNGNNNDIIYQNGGAKAPVQNDPQAIINRTNSMNNLEQLVAQNKAQEEEKVNQLAGLYQAADMGAMIADSVINSGAYNDMYYVDPNIKDQAGSQLKDSIVNQMLQNIIASGPQNGESAEDYIKRMQRMGY